MALTTLTPSFSAFAKVSGGGTGATVSANGSASATFVHDHLTSGTAVNNAKIQSNKTVSGYSGKTICYGTTNTHSHEGNATSGGNCYNANPVYHTHKDSCHSRTYHYHTEACKNYAKRYTLKVYGGGEKRRWNSYYCSICNDYHSACVTTAPDGRIVIDICSHDSAMVPSGKPACEGVANGGVVQNPYEMLFYYDNQTQQFLFADGNKRCGRSLSPLTADQWNNATYWDGTYKCGYSQGQLISDNIICGKTTSTIEGYTYSLKNPDPYYTGTVYTNSCAYSSGATVGTAKMSVDGNNKMTLTLGTQPSGCSYETVWKKDGTTISATNNAYQIIENGTYTCTVTCYSKPDGATRTNEGSYTFTYVAVPHDTTVNLYDFDNSLIKTYTMKRGSETSPVVVPTRTGYTFVNYTDSANNQYYNASGVNTKGKFCDINGGTINLYAKYNANPYKVNYEINNTYIDSSTIKQDTFNFDTLAKLTNPAKTYTGYTFRGWYDSTNKLMFKTDGTYAKNNGIWNVANDVTVDTLYYPNQYVLHYSLTKEENTNDHYKKIYFDEAYGLSAEDKASVPTYAGYTFDGWYDNNNNLIFDVNGNNTDTGIWKWDRDIFATARFIANPYNVTVKYENPSKLASDVSTETETFTYDELAKFSHIVPIYKGYTLLGYNEGSTKLFDENGLYVNNNGVWDIATGKTVVADYIPNDYVITYDLDKEDRQTHTLSIKYEDEPVLPNAKTYKGYTFNGWYNGATKYFEPDGKFALTNGYYTVDNSLTVNAKYTANNYVVNYNISDNGATDKTLAVTFDDTYAIPSSVVATVVPKTGYTFDGWVDADGNMIFDETGKSIAPVYDYDSDITVYTKYHANVYDLYYSLNRDEDVTANHKSITFDTIWGLSSTEKASVPTYKGYTLQGWFDGTKQIIKADKTNTDGNIWKYPNTVNARIKYTPNPYVVKYNLADNDTDYKTLDVVYDSPYGLPTADVNNVADKTGYTFVGWFNGTDKVFNVDGTSVESVYAKYDSDITTNATYTPNNYTFKWSINKGGDKVWTTKVVTYDAPYSLENKADVITYKGYTLQGYFVDGDMTGTKIFNADGTNAHNSVWKFAEDISAEGIYTQNPYKIYYNTNETEDATNVLDVVYDNPYKLPQSVVNSVPTKDGYTFDGWYYNGKQIFDVNGKSFEPVYNLYDKDITVKVKYHKNEYTIKYNDTDIEDLDLTNTVVTYDDNYDDVAKAPYKKGYEFKGYYTTDDLDNVGGKTYVWDNLGKAFNPFKINLGEDHTTVTVNKEYTPKVFTVNIGEDVNANGKLDVSEIEETQTVTYDSAYFEYNVPVLRDGYTLLGFYLTGTDKCIAEYDMDSNILTKADSTWVYDDDEDWNGNANHNTVINVDYRFVPNTYDVIYNDTTTDDNDLDKTQTVEFDKAYADIEEAPYKVGYEFNGHYIDNADNDHTFVWDAFGKVVRPIWDFVCGKMGNTQSAYKDYTPKTYTVSIGEDYNEDKKLDNVDDTISVTYDSTFVDLPIPTDKDGLTFDGYYILGTDTCVAKYNAETDKITKTSDTWVYDDGIDYRVDGNHDYKLELEKRWTHDTLSVVVRTQTDKRVENKTEYEWLVDNIETQFDYPYDDYTVPKDIKGYTFKGYKRVDANGKVVETKPLVYDVKGKATEKTFIWLPDTDNRVVVNSIFEQNTYKVEIPYTVEVIVDKPVNPNDNNGGDDKETVKEHIWEEQEPIVIEYKYDEPYDPIRPIPEREGYIFDGIDDIEGNPIWDKDGNPTRPYVDFTPDEIGDKKWTPKWYILEYADGKEEKVVFDAPVNKIDTVGKNGHTFGGYSMVFRGKEIAVFNGSGEYNGKVWTYDFGESGTRIKLNAMFNVNGYSITLNPNNNEPEFNVGVTYGRGYTDVPIPTKNGYTFNGYVAEDGTVIYDKFGKPTLETYPYAGNTNVIATYVAENYTLNCDGTKIPVTYNEKVGKKAPVVEKDGYIFKGWYYNGKLIFREDGTCVYATWLLDLGDDGVVVNLTPVFEEEVIEIVPEDNTTDNKPHDTDDVETPEEPTIIDTVDDVPTEIKVDKGIAKGVVIATATMLCLLSLIGLIIGLIFFIIFLLFVNGFITKVYKYDYDKDKDRLIGFAKIKRYKKDEKEDEVKFYINLKEKYGKHEVYNALLDENAKLISVKLSKNFYEKHNKSEIRLSCKELYDEFVITSGLKGVFVTDKEDRVITVQMHKHFN